MTRIIKIQEDAIKKTEHLFSRNVLALETFFPIAEAFQEKYEPDGSTCQNKVRKIKVLLYLKNLTCYINLNTSRGQVAKNTILNQNIQDIEQKCSNLPIFIIQCVLFITKKKVYDRKGVIVRSIQPLSK